MNPVRSGMQTAQVSSGEENEAWSGWIGRYVSADDQILTITQVNASGIWGSFYGYSEDGWSERTVTAYFANGNTSAAIENITNMFGEKIDERQYIMDSSKNVIQIRTGYGSFADGEYYRQ